jgi:hypothetical protein
MSLHLRAQPSSHNYSHLPSVVDHRALSGPPPASYLRTAANFRAPAPSLNLPSFSRPTQPPVKCSIGRLSQRYLVPCTPGPSGSNVQSPALLAPPAGYGAEGTSETPTVAIGSRALRHGSDPVVGNVEFDETWIESHVAELEVMARQDSGEKGQAYLGIWLGLREAGFRDKKSVLQFIAEKLVPYPWYQGNETIREALRALGRLEYINAGLLAKKHTENANWFWNKKIGNVKVRDYWVAEATKLRQKKQQAHVEAQQ